MSTQGYFVTGTDTSVGKTCVTTGLMKVFRQSGKTVVGMKPVASGCRQTSAGLRNADAERLIEASSSSMSYDLHNPIAFEPAIAPHIAAAEMHQDIDFAVVQEAYGKLTAKIDISFVEGVGGWLVPLGSELTTEDLAVSLNLPVILVVAIRLGCISQALLTARAIEQCGLSLAGWVANGLDPLCDRSSEIIESLRSRLPAACLGAVPYLGQQIDGNLAPYLVKP